MDGLTTCSDIDMKSGNADGRFKHKSGSAHRIGWGDAWHAD